MIDVKEHIYDDDPAKGPSDVRTRLKDVSYFFIGNGHIQAAVQIAPSGDGTPIGLLIMDPEKLGRKRDVLTMDPESGLASTQINIFSQKSDSKSDIRNVKATWSYGQKIPSVEVHWETVSFKITEEFFCPDHFNPGLIRTVKIKNLSDKSISAKLKTGIHHNFFEKDIFFGPGERKIIGLHYFLDKAGRTVFLEPVSGVNINTDTARYWDQVSKASFDSTLLDFYFLSSGSQLSAMVSHSGKVDASIWQYNREWVRDHSMIAIGLILSGHFDTARKLLVRLLADFVTQEGDHRFFSQRREPDDVELDQNGELLYALEQYVLWTGDLTVIAENWDKIKVTAEFPLNKMFRHEESGLSANCREYWERHRMFGITEGIELTYQLFTCVGLFSAAALARMVSREEDAQFWEKEAERIKNTMISHEKFSLVSENALIKRRGIDGKVQEKIEPLPGAGLPESAPLVQVIPHYLNPDSSVVLPIALGAVAPDSSLASGTLDSCELLWNQDWYGGGYGRYHYASEPDSPGAWPFPSLFIARAYAETGDYEKVWRILEWLNTLPGAMSGSWFEFYGRRESPPFPQVGIPPWTWAEIQILLVYHIIGIQPGRDTFSLRPRLLPGLEELHASFPFRKDRLNIKIRRAKKNESTVFLSNKRILRSSDREAVILYSEGDAKIDAVVR